jgi:nucleotide-binding universal stress UspA family protein
MLTHVVDDDQPQRLIDVERREAAALLQELTTTIRETDGIDCDSQVALGDGFQGIVRMAEENDVDLLVLGPHRRQILRDAFFGTTAERVVRTSRRPVLMANGVPAGAYRRVLVATDFSDLAFAAAQAAKELGLFAAAEIVALHVVDPDEGGPILRAAVRVKEAEDRADEMAARAREELDIFMRKLGIVAARRVITEAGKSTSMAINKYAEATKADLVVVGTHGRSGIENWLLGSVAENVLRHAETDVLAVPPSVKPTP